MPASVSSATSPDYSRTTLIPNPLSPFLEATKYPIRSRTVAILTKRWTSGKEVLVYETKYVFSVVPATKGDVYAGSSATSASNLEVETQNQFFSEGNTDNAPTPCKFFLPLKIAELGLNAHVHLAQLLKLARALNRTLVLPNGVGS